MEVEYEVVTFPMGIVEEVEEQLSRQSPALSRIYVFDNGKLLPAKRASQFVK